MTPKQHRSVAEAIDNPPNNRGINTPHSRTRPPTKNPRLSILTHLKAGLGMAKIKAKLGIPESTLQYHLSVLKKQGIIRKVGYGTWEILYPSATAEKTTAGSSHVGRTQHPRTAGQPRVLSQTDLTQFTKNAVRAHAFVFTLQVPKGLRNWNNKMREQYMKTNNIPYVHLNIGGEGQRISVMGRKVWLTNTSIIIYDKASYLAELARDAKSLAVSTHMSIVRRIEKMLNADFQIHGDYRFRISRQHYALLQNALAKQYDDDGRKLEIRTDRGLWFLIDNSFNLNEAETVHPRTAQRDNENVQAFFNGVDKTGITPEFILAAMNEIQENQAAFAENIKSHIGAIQDLGAGVRNLNALLDEERRR